MTKNSIQRLLGDIRFWILLFFVLRLFGITNPPLEVAHNWRQTTVTMVARNFYEVDPNIALPRIDFAGNKSGITGMEFPLLNYLIYLISLVFGYTHWYGRLINLAVSSVGIYFFYRIVNRFFSKDLAFYSSIILLSSLWFVYSRKVMPDTFSTSLVITGFWYCIKYLDQNGHAFINVLMFGFLTLAGILSKIPSAFLLVFLVPLLLQRNSLLKQKLIILLCCFLIMIPTVFWYFYWVPYLVEQYGFWHFFMGESILQGSKDLIKYVGNVLAHFYDAAFKFIGFGLFLAGLILSILQKVKQRLSVHIIFLLGFMAFLPIMLKGGYTFAHHSYYIIPLIPVLALVAGYALTCIPSRKIAVAILILVCLENVLNRQHDFRLKEKEKAIASLEEALDQVSDRHELIVINSDNVPTPMYFAHRKGWLASNEQLHKPEYVDELTTQGCKYAVVLKRYFGEDTQLPYLLLLDNKDYKVYDITKK